MPIWNSTLGGYHAIGGCVHSRGQNVVCGAGNRPDVPTGWITIDGLAPWRYEVNDTVDLDYGAFVPAAWRLEKGTNAIFWENWTTASQFHIFLQKHGICAFRGPACEVAQVLGKWENELVAYKLSCVAAGTTTEGRFAFVFSMSSLVSWAWINAALL